MLDKNDKKTISMIVIEAIDTLIIPRLENIDKDIKGLKEDVGGLKEDMEIVKEDISDLQATSNRIETLAKSEIKYVDDLSERVLKLEKSKA